jgi:hypothetical protein
MKISDFFQSSESIAKTHTWTLAQHDPEVSPADALAEVLAERIVEFRCRGCPHHFQAWKRGVEGEPSLPKASKAALEAFIRPVFGLRDNKDEVTKDHLEGFIAEHLWYFLCMETASTETIVRIEPPDFAVTDPGGDGLIIHRILDGELMFRLWEIKKCAGNCPVNSTINTAYGQLNANALEYLARYSGIGQELQDAELSNFYGQLVELWLDAEPGAAAGVSVATSSNNVPARCFSTFGKQFPQFVDPVRLKGMLTAIGDFPDFACKVREFVWKGL